ncbi:MAG: hypothetical protein CMJ19_09965 [Phycisphaeraceae bacterium]|nr:hypothetical protein [Phycisphaeraceae bacterium]
MKPHRFIVLLLCLLALGPAWLWAQSSSEANNSNPPEANLSYMEEQNSPRDTMKFFLTAIRQAVHEKQTAAWDRVQSCLDMSQANPDRLQEIATDLWEVINRLEFIDWETTTLPDAQAAADMATYTYFPKRDTPEKFKDLARYGNIVFKKNDDGRWLFSAATVKNSHELYLAFEDIQTVKGLEDVQEMLNKNWLRKKIPASLKGINHTVLTLEYWQWLGVFIVALLGVILDHIIRAILGGISRKLIARHTTTEHAKSIGTAVRPIGLLGAAILWYWFLRMLQLPDTAYTILAGAIQVFGTFSAVWAAWRITDLASEVLMDKALKTDNKFDDVLVPLIRKTVKIFIVAFGLIYGAQSLNINILPLITGLGIGGLAFAFAAKDTIENFFGSIAVILDRPFEVGDWVVIDGTEGTVVELGFRSTRIRTFYDSLITVPNAALVRATVDNYGRRRYRRWKTFIGIQYDTKPEKMVEFVEGIRQLIKEHPHTRKDYFHVYYNQFGPYSLDILLYVFHEVPDWSMELQERERLFIDIFKLAGKIGVNFAFPTQTLHVAPHDPSPEITVNFSDTAKKQIEKQQRKQQDGDGRAYT